jgi:hypothetical protein
MSYSSDRAWSDRFRDDIRSIVGSLPSSVIGVDVSPASLEQDMREATDLVLQYKGGVIGCRMYRAAKRNVALHEITVRALGRGGSPRGNELAKLLAGFGTFYFFGWAANNDDTRVADWCFLDLDRFRSAIANGELMPERRFPDKPRIQNEDGSMGEVFEPQRVKGLVRACSLRWDETSPTCLCTRCKNVRQLELDWRPTSFFRGTS